MAQDMSIYGMMFRKRSHVSTKFAQMTYVKSSDLIKPPEEFFQKHLQQIPPSIRLAAEKVQVIETFTSAKPWSAAARSARGHRWHWGRGRRRRSRRRRTFHRPRRSRPMCGYCGLRAPFRSGTADSSDWPGKRVAKIWSWYAFYKYLQVNTKLATCRLPAIYPNSCFSSFLTSPSSLRWVEMHLAAWNKAEELALNYFHVCIFHRPCLEFRCWAGCWIQFYRSWVQCPISFWPWSKSMLLPRCHSMSLRIRKKTSFMLAGLSLRGIRAMRSFLQAMETRWKSASPNIPKPSLSSPSGAKRPKPLKTGITKRTF